VFVMASHSAELIERNHPIDRQRLICNPIDSLSLLHLKYDFMSLRGIPLRVMAGLICFLRLISLSRGNNCRTHLHRLDRIGQQPSQSSQQDNHSGESPLSQIPVGDMMALPDRALDGLTGTTPESRMAWAANTPVPYDDVAIGALGTLGVIGGSLRIEGALSRDGQLLYRGVPGNGTQKAILGQQGIAVPRGTAVDEGALIKHVLGEDVNAGVTSWTTDRTIAQRFSGADGTIIEVDLNRVLNQVIQRPNIPKYSGENEILLRNTVQGRPTRP